MQPLKFSLTLITIGLFSFSSPIIAQIYKTINPDGSVTYSDQGADNTPALDAPPIQHYSPVNKPKPIATQKTAPAITPKAATVYTTFSIASPTHDEAIRANTGAVTVTLNLTPALDTQQGDKISVSLNGQAIGAPGTQTSFNLDNLERGSHTLTATLMSANGATIKTAKPITFHILKTHVNR